MGTFCHGDILSWGHYVMGTFCHGDILCGDIVSSGTICHGDNLERGHFVWGHFLHGDIFYMGIFCTWGHFVLLPTATLVDALVVSETTNDNFFG